MLAEASGGLIVFWAALVAQDSNTQSVSVMVLESTQLSFSAFILDQKMSDNPLPVGRAEELKQLNTEQNLL